MWLFVLLSFYASWQTAITLCINLYYFYYKLYAIEVDATADRGDSAMDPFFIRHEFWVFVIDLPLTGKNLSYLVYKTDLCFSRKKSAGFLKKNSEKL